MDVLNAYANLVCYSNHEHSADRGEIFMSHLAAFGGDEFTEWGTHFIIDRRVQDLIWEAAVIRVLRQAPLEAGDRERSQRHASGNEDRHIRGSLQPSCAETTGTSATLMNWHLVLKDKEDDISNSASGMRS